METQGGLRLDVESLRGAIRGEYEAVAKEPGRGFHFHTGRPLARLLGYEEEWLRGIPEGSIESFAGTGNPFRMGAARPGEPLSMGASPPLVLGPPSAARRLRRAALSPPTGEPPGSPDPSPRPTA